MQSPPDALAALQQLRADLPDNDHDERLLKRVYVLVQILKDLGQGSLTLRVQDGQLVTLDVYVSRGPDHP
jgi:hypothetical protein